MDAKHLPLLAILALLTLLAACSGAEVQPDPTPAQGPRPERARFSNLSTSGRDTRAEDLNNDGKPDQWYITDGSRLVRTERDLNFDGTPDVYLYPDPANAEVVIEEEMDLDTDGVVDVVNYYQNGIIHRKELAVDFTGALAVIKYFDPQGNLSRVERDANNDGKIDTWEYWQDGSRVRTGRDNDGDGAPDVFDEVGG